MNIDHLKTIYTPQMIEQMTAALTPVPDPSQFPNPTKYKCEACRNTDWTKVNYQVGCTAISWGVFLTMGFVCCLPCCLDPYKDAKHACGRCGRDLGVYKRPCCLKPV
jgi:hypothetical protein